MRLAAVILGAGLLFCETVMAQGVPVPQPVIEKMIYVPTEAEFQKLSKTTQEAFKNAGVQPIRVEKPQTQNGPIKVEVKPQPTEQKVEVAAKSVESTEKTAEVADDKKDDAIAEKKDKK